MKRCIPKELLQSGHAPEAPVSNAAFAPDERSTHAPEFQGTLKIDALQLRTWPEMEQRLIHGRDVQLFPGLELSFFTLGNLLLPVERGQMVHDRADRQPASYWRVIPETGRVWRQPEDGDWSRAAFPLMLVNDTENQAHQGLAQFLYRPGRVSALAMQFVQQSAPYLIKPCFVAWGCAQAQLIQSGVADLDAERARAHSELADRLPARPWSDLKNSLPPGTLDGFGGALSPQWQVAAALVRNGTLYYQAALTPYGAYPYPLQMRFGVRSVTKAVFAPLALLHLAKVYGPAMLSLNIGDYVPLQNGKWRRVRFIDAANMATGFGAGSTRTEPNNIYDGYLEGGYDAWYTAPSLSEKIGLINAQWHPFPWEPGTLVRYRDQDFFLLGAALDSFLKRQRGPEADLGDMVRTEILAPIGIHQVPTVRTQEAGGVRGLICCNAGYYPTLDDLAKIALLYQARGSHGGTQLLDYDLTADLLSGRHALSKSGTASATAALADGPALATGRYQMGLHFRRYQSVDGSQRLVPIMHGSGENEVILYPNGLVSIVMANSSAAVPGAERRRSDDAPAAMRAIERLQPF